MGVVLATTLAVTLALAGTISAPRDPSTLIHGDRVEECAWPAIAAGTMGGAFGGAATCAYTMIHPQLVATFNQCTGPFVGDFRLGDDATDGSFQDVEVDSDTCMWHPELPIAVCALVEPITSFPIPPIMMGCETGLLEEGLGPTACDDGEASSCSVATRDRGTSQLWLLALLLLGGGARSTATKIGTESPS